MGSPPRLGVLYLSVGKRTETGFEGLGMSMTGIHHGGVPPLPRWPGKRRGWRCPPTEESQTPEDMLPPPRGSARSLSPATTGRGSPGLFFGPARVLRLGCLQPLSDQRPERVGVRH